MRGFSLIETVVALSLAGVIGATVIASFAGAQGDQGKAKREWLAFSIAQQQLELLAALPDGASLLTANDSTTTGFGTASDKTCSGIPLGPNHFRVDELGVQKTNGQFEVCRKIKSGNPLGSLLNIRVVVLYEYGGTDGILLQTIR